MQIKPSLSTTGWKKSFGKFQAVQIPLKLLLILRIDSLLNKECVVVLLLRESLMYQSYSMVLESRMLMPKRAIFSLLGLCEMLQHSVYIRWLAQHLRNLL
ncbi:hypothetical protein D8M41_01405 [Rothia sp. HSID18069]|nr:hypothetical protein D8M41_01405 [Rothia sp. HSID18069]